MVLREIPCEFGGLTRMALYRAGLFLEQGIEASVLTFDPNGQYEALLDSVREQGLLHEQVPVINIFNWHQQRLYQHREPLENPVSSEGCIPPDVHQQTDVDSGGNLFSRSTLSVDGSYEYRREYFRPDGSTFAIDEKTTQAGGRRATRLISIMDHQNSIIE